MKVNFNNIQINKTNFLATLAIAFFLATIPIVTFAYEKPAPEIVRVKLGEVVSMNSFTHTITILVASSSSEITVRQSASTTIFTGSGDETSVDSIKKGSKIYVFGVINVDTMNAEKVVIKNQSKLSRDFLKDQETDVAISENDTTFLAFLNKIWKGVTFTTVYGASRIEQSLISKPNKEENQARGVEQTEVKLAIKTII